MSQDLFPPAVSGLRLRITDQPEDHRGQRLCHGCFPTPIGTAVVLGTGQAIWGLGLTGAMTADEVLQDLAVRWPGASLTEAPEVLRPAIEALLRDQGEVTLRLVGTAFQVQVWRALTEVPAGQVIRYADLAERIGRPKALRAVGTAVGQNPVSWLVPCHRVTRSDGSIGGYHWGTAVKRALLAREGASFAPDPIAAL